MPAPYPKWFEPGVVKAVGTKGYRQMCKQKVVNFAILALSWLHLNRTNAAPPELSLQTKLSRKQWAVVHRIEKLLDEIAVADAVGPAQMGRTAAKVESLDSLLETLHGVALSMLPESYKRRPHEPGFLKVGVSTDAGKVVGHLKTSHPIVAQEVETPRLSVPMEPPEFRPGDLLPPHHLAVFEDPLKFASDPLTVSTPPPKVHLHASRQQAFDLLRFLDERQRLSLAPKTEVRSKHLCGVFALIKDQDKDRMILDARPPNLLEEALTDWTRTLGSVTALTQLELRPGHQLWLSGTDLCDYYYCYRVSKRRARRNALAFPLTPQQASFLQCFDESMKEHEVLYPCLATLAMGDNQAVELGQCAHLQLGFTSTAFATTELLTVHGRAPRGNVACGVVIDDVLIAEQVLPASAPAYSDGEARLDRLCEEYLQRGLKPHPKKTFRRADRAECWGALIDGKTGLVRASPKRLVPLMWITSRVALLGFATVGLLQVLAGSWISVLQVRRRMLCLLEHIYFAQQGRDQDAIIALSPCAISELWCLVSLGPLAVTDLSARSHRELFMSDASEEFTASVKSELTWSFVKELQRHCLARGTWGKLLTPWQQWLKSHDQLEISEELPAGVPLVSHPLWLELAEALPFKLHHKRHCKTKKHINLLELQSILELEERLALRHRDCRYVLAADSQVALAVIVKGRSSSPSLNTLLRKSLPNILGNGSLANVADDPTRGQPIRQPLRETIFDLAACLRGDFLSLDAWLGKIGFLPEQVAALPFCDGSSHDPQILNSLLVDPLRRVQKPERMARFDEGNTAPCHVSPLDGTDNKNDSREKNEPNGQTKKQKKRPQENEEIEERPITAVPVVLKRVTPPSKRHVHVESSDSAADCAAAPPRDLQPAASRRKKHCRNEASQLPALSAQAKELLAALPPGQFLRPGGIRAQTPFEPSRRGFLDLYSGAAGVAKSLSKLFDTWVLTFDFCHGEGQNLMDPAVQTAILQLIDAGALAQRQSAAVFRERSTPLCDRENARLVSLISLKTWQRRLLQVTVMLLLFWLCSLKLVTNISSIGRRTLTAPSFGLCPTG